MDKYYLAVDIGASSGRHILASMEDGRMRLEEIHRFPNGMDNKDGTLCWDVARLFTEIKKGLKKCREQGRIPVSMAIDTWGVDYVLLGKGDQIIGEVVGYRDSRTDGMDDKVYKKISSEDLYARTGIQKQIFNTIYQLMAVKETHPRQLEQAEAMLMIPDYLHFLLTGVKKMEYTNATTSQLINSETNDWDYELIELLGYPKKLFRPVSMPGTVVGGFTKEIQEELGFDCTVVLPATHDTGSAVLAVPSNAENVIYISSGTWSLMGVEQKEADCSMKSREANFTNEGGYGHRYRFLKNIMGLWMIQSVKRELEGEPGAGCKGEAGMGFKGESGPEFKGKSGSGFKGEPGSEFKGECRSVFKEGLGEKLTYGEMCEMASRESIPSLVDCNDDCFLAPESMIRAVQNYCRRTDQPVPQSVGEIAAVIYNSLGKCYGGTVKEIEDITGRIYDSIYVVGGGANADYLNELTARYTRKKVYAGPTEATAIGNIIVQMLWDGVFGSLQEARSCVGGAFDIKSFDEQQGGRMNGK